MVARAETVIIHPFMLALRHVSHCGAGTAHPGAHDFVFKSSAAGPRNESAGASWPETCDEVIVNLRAEAHGVNSQWAVYAIFLCEKWMRLGLGAKMRDAATGAGLTTLGKGP